MNICRRAVGVLLAVACFLVACETQVQQDVKLHRRFGQQALIYHLKADYQVLVASSNHLFYVVVGSTDATDLQICEDVTDFLQIQFKKDQ